MVQQLPLMTVTTPPQGPELEPEDDASGVERVYLKRHAFPPFLSSHVTVITTTTCHHGHVITADAVAVSHLMSEVSDATHQTRVVLHRSRSEVK